MISVANISSTIIKTIELHKGATKVALEAVRLKKQVLEQRNRKNYEFYMNEQAEIEETKMKTMATNPVYKQYVLLENERNKLDVQLIILKADLKLHKKKKHEKLVYSMVFFAKYVVDNWQAQKEKEELETNVLREKQERQKIGKCFS